MSSENSIEVRDLTKKFKVYYDKGSSLKERIIFKNRNKYEERSVLNGISFDVKKGEGIGLIGHNGCGKSTTLKLLTRIIYPDSGAITMNGRVSSLIELGAGFHPDMSGRENIYINAAIFGLKKEEIDARLDRIIEFSELKEYIDNPVRTYSSGMYMRLAFSVAINVDADILLIDEILAVGDAAFQAKCFSKLKEIKKNGTTIVIVSHSLDQIEAICDSSIWLDEGVIRMEGKPEDVHLKYLEYMGVISPEKEEEEIEEKIEYSGEDFVEASDVVVQKIMPNYGFHNPEYWDDRTFYWMSEKRAQMLINAEAKSQSTELRIIYNHMIPEDRYLKRYVLKIKFNNHEIIEQEITKHDDEILIPIDKQDRERKIWTVDVEIPYLWKPSMLIGTDDNRDLGLALNFS